MLFIIFAPDFEAADRILDDVKKENNVIYIRRRKDISEIDKMLNLSKQICFFYFNPWTDWAYKSGFLEKMKEKYVNSIHIVFFLDVYAARKLDIEGMKKEFTEMFIFDEFEAKNLNISYYPNIFSRISVRSSDVVNDVSFVGQAKNRYDKLIKIYEILTRNSVKCDFYIVGVEPENQKYKNEIKYGDFISYEEACLHIMRSKCVLEIMLEQCYSYSNRVLEAIANNKKILTNNENVRKIAFYNKNWIHIFKDIEKIDIDFLKDNVKVDYKYNNEFSPVNFLKFIEEKYDI